jgi:hypothetical protein
MKEFKVSVILSSGTSAYYDVIHLINVKKFHTISGYYYFETEDGLQNFFQSIEQLYNKLNNYDLQTTNEYCKEGQRQKVSLSCWLNRNG